MAKASQSNTIVSLQEVVDHPLAPEARAATGMITFEERSFLHGYAETKYSGKGVIVDAGTFLGASTICFGLGLRKNAAYKEIVKKWKRPIKSYERAIFVENLKRTFDRRNVEGHFEEGDSFEHVLRERIAEVADLVDLRIGDILSTAWTGEPIEILFLDIIKTEPIQWHVLEHFFGNLIPGAIVIQQDFFIESHPYVKIYQEKLGQHFEFIAQLQSSGVFKLTSPITEDEIKALHDISVEEQVQLLEAVRQKTEDPFRQTLIEISKVFAMKRGGAVDNARELITAVEEKLPEDAHWRLRMACDRARGAVGLPMRREKHGWRPERQRARSGAGKS